MFAKGNRFPIWFTLLMCLGAVRPASAQETKAKGRSSARITVKISDDKVRTKFTVKKGEWLEFQCEGKWRVWEGYSFVGPEGQSNMANAQGRWATLVAKIGAGPAFGYGDGLPVQANASGEVVLWPNRPWEPVIDKGEGALIVTIRVGEHLKTKRAEVLATLKRQTDELLADKEVQGCLAAINHLRKVSGLKPVNVDTKLSIGCTKHAKYLTLNRGSPLIAGLKAHDEHEELPGYSLDGQDAGQSSAIQFSPPSDFRPYFTTFYHRIVFLLPELTDVGIGYDHRDGAWNTVVNVRSATEGKSHKAIVYCPEDQQRGIPLTMTKEYPDPIPESHQGKPAGFPITIQFTQNQKVTKAEFKLSDDKGNNIPCHVSSPEFPALKTYPAWVQAGTICAIPMTPLMRSTTYRAELRCSISGKAMMRTWQFTTEEE